MATVGDMVDIFDALFGKGHESFSTKIKIKLLNLGQREVWKLLVGASGQKNWFVVESQSATPGQDDFFPTITTTSKEYALPPNFHQMRSMRISTSGFDGTFFKKVHLDDHDFMSEDQNTTFQWTDDVNYDIMGTNPGSIVFSAFPPSALTIVLRYVRTPTEWTLLAGTEPDEYPVALHSLIAEWAAKRALLGLADNRFSAYEDEWQKRIRVWMSTFRRDNTDAPNATGFLE